MSIRSMIHPTFSYPVFEQLYTRDYFIEDAVLREILALGPEQAVPELLKIIDATLENYHAGLLTNSNWSGTYYFHHALYLLHELHAPEAFDVHHRMLQLDSESTEFWFGDYLFEDVPDLLARAAHTRLPELLALLEDKSMALQHRMIVSDAVSRLIRAQPALRPVALEFLQGHLRRIIADPTQARQVFPTDAGTYGYALEDYLGMLVADVQQAGLQELEPELRTLHGLDLVDESIAGGADDIQFDEPVPPPPSPDIFARYQELRDDPDNYSPFHPDAAGIARRRAEQQARYARQRQQYQQPRQVLPKIGRNDPCPCGSGKKYKKCCGA